MAKIFLFLVLLSILPPLFPQSPPGAPDSAGLLPFQNSLSPAAPLDLVEVESRGDFSAEKVFAGDTLSYVVSVEWVNPKIPITVLAPESLLFSGFKKLGASTNHKKIAQQTGTSATLKNKSVFVYNLRAEIPGTGKASGTRLPYLSAASEGKLEYLPLSPALIDILPAKIPWMNRTWVRIFLVTALLGILLAAIAVIRPRLKAKPKSGPGYPDYLALSRELKARLAVADSKNILEEMEKIAVLFLQESLKSKSDNYQKLVTEYLNRFDAKNKELWQILSQDFELAKFGGGRKASHEISESYKHLLKCIQNTGE